MYTRTSLSRFRRTAVIGLALSMWAGFVYANKESKSLYTHFVQTYDKEYVDISAAEKKLETLEEEYSIAKHNNLKVESYEALREYAIDIEQDINLKIDEEVEKITTAQREIVNKIETNLLTLPKKELSILNRTYSKHKEDIDELLKDKTSISELFNDEEHKNSLVDLEELEVSIQEQQAILSYDSSYNNTDLGELDQLKVPFNYTKRVTSNAGYRTDPIHGAIRYHNATDYGLPIGTELYSVFNGIVTLSENTGNGYGENIKIDCGNGIVLHYAHLDKRLVSVGDKVKQNELIGLSGNTGRSTGPHLHLSLFHKGEVLDIERLWR